MGQPTKQKSMWLMVAMIVFGALALGAVVCVTSAYFFLSPASHQATPVVQVTDSMDAAGSTGEATPALVLTEQATTTEPGANANDALPAVNTPEAVDGRSAAYADWGGVYSAMPMQFNEVLLIEPFPFRIQGNMPRLHKSSDFAPHPNWTTWTFVVTNTSEEPQTFEEIQIYGMLSTAHFLYNGEEVDTPPDANLPKIVPVHKVIAPGESYTIELNVTTYLGGANHGVLSFCAQGEQTPLNCFAVTVETSTTPDE